MAAEKIAIVTGASSGMGKEFVRIIPKTFKDLDEIWCVSRRPFSEKPEKRIRNVCLDLLKEESYAELSRLLKEEKPEIKLLINSAGMGMIGEVSEIDYTDLCREVRLNDEALTAVTRLALDYMAEGSYILNVASGSAFMPQPKFAVYAASKAYVLSFSRALKRELKKKKISVTALCPGPVKTGFFDTATKYRDIAKWKKPFMASPEKICAQGIKDMLKNKDISFGTLSMQLFYILSKIVPHGLMLRFL